MAVARRMTWQWLAEAVVGGKGGGGVDGGVDAGVSVCWRWWCWSRRLSLLPDRVIELVVCAVAAVAAAAAAAETARC